MTLRYSLPTPLLLRDSDGEGGPLVGVLRIDPCASGRPGTAPRRDPNMDPQLERFWPFSPLHREEANKRTQGRFTDTLPRGLGMVY